MAASLAILERFSVKKWLDLEIWVWGHLKSLKLVPFESLDAVFFSSAIVTVALSCIVCEI